MKISLLRRLFVVRILSIIFSFVEVISATHAQSYEAVPIGFDAFALNNSGVIVGFSGTNNGYAVSFSSGAVVNLFASTSAQNLFYTGVSGSQSIAYGINDAGTIVGFGTINSSYIDNAFSCTNGVVSDLGTLGGQNSGAAAINNSGVIVGGAQPIQGNRHAFIYSNGVMTDLGTLGGATSEATAISDTGIVAGNSMISGNSLQEHAFNYSNGIMTDLGTLPGYTDTSIATGVNNSGTIVGRSASSLGVTHAFIYSNGVMADLGTLGGNSSVADGINNAGEVVGGASTAGGVEHAFIYRNGLMVDLNTLVNLSGVTLAEGIAINDSGEIVANDDNFNSYFLFTPPAQFIIFSSPIGQVYGAAPFALNGTATSGLPITYAIVNGPATITGNILTITGAGTVTIEASQSGNGTFNSASPVLRSFNVGMAMPVITWPAPAAIAAGTPLGSAQLDASANVPGTFSYNPAPGTILPFGSQLLTVTFTPTDTADYYAAYDSVPLTVAHGPTIFYVTNSTTGLIYGVTADGSVPTYAYGLSIPVGIALDAGGNLYVANEGTGSILKIPPGGGGGSSIFATGFLNSASVGLAFDGNGNLYVANYNDGEILKISPGGSSSTFASGLLGPSGLTFDHDGNLYVSDEGDNTIEKITPTGMISIVASGLSNPTGIAFDGNGNLYVANYAINTIDKIAPNGSISTFSSTGLDEPIGLAFDENGSLYVANFGNNTISKFAPGNSSPTTFATGLSGPAFLATTAYTPLPTFTLNPASQVVTTGRSVAFNVQTTGGPTPTYQWTFNGTPILGATDAIFLLSNITTANAGTYACFASNSTGSVTSASATLSVVSGAEPGYLDNISSRATIGTGSNILIAGFTVAGSGSIDLLLRGVGPALIPAPYSVAGAIPTTQMTLYDSNDLGPFPIVTNSGWSNTFTRGTSSVSVSPQAATLTLMNALGAFTNTWVINSADSALEVTPPAGGYTSQISGLGGATGIGLAEVYDADPYTPSTRLVNISSRAQVGVGNNILIGGFEIGGGTGETVLIRAVGPTLASAPYNVPGAIAQPVLTVYSGSTPLYSNTGWGSDSTIAGIFNTVGAFALNASSTDSALLITLPPGGYTAEVSGVNNTTGVALIEIYEVY
jgi:probable HAF family extracellular repeat protein